MIVFSVDVFFQFIKTPKFLAIRNWDGEFDPTENDFLLLSQTPSQPPGLNGGTEEVGGAYITISQQGSEREHRQQLALAASQREQEALMGDR